MEHGKVIIGTKLSTSQLEKDLTKAEKDLNKFSKEEDKLLEKKQRLEIDTAKTENNLQKIDDKLELINKQIADMEQANLPENLVGNIDYQKLINQREELNRKGTIGLQTLDLQKGKLTQINLQLENNRKKQDELNKRLKLSNIEFDKANKGLTKTIKKVAKWGLAIFGVRSAYMAVRSAMGIISQYDDKLASNIDYIKYALAYTLKPIVEWILNAVIKLLQYINYIAKAWTGKNLFKTADAFKNAQKGAKGLNKELQKTTASFDEMNVLQDTKSSGGGVSAPSIDLTELPEGDVPKWVEGIKNFGLWVKENWKEIIAILLGIGAVILMFKLFSKTSKEMVPSITEGANAFLKMAGLALILGAFALVLHEIANLIEKFGKSGLKLTDVIGLMATVLGTIVILMGSVALLGPAMTAGLVPFLAIVGGISAILLVMAATLPIILDAVGKFIQQTAPSLNKILQTIGTLIQNIILALGTTLPPIIEEVGKIFNTIFGGVAKIISTVGNVIVNIMKTADKLVNSVLQAIINFINKLGPAINNFVDGAIKAVTKLINFVVSGIEYLINTVIVSPINSLIKTINKIPGVDISLMKEANIPRFRPRLAKGGIINQPGRGIPVGSAIGGERGQEGVIPLTDSQQMQLLGEAIGRYVTINANIINTMNGRVISRELQKVNNANDFAFNR